MVVADAWINFTREGSQPMSSTHSLNNDMEQSPYADMSQGIPTPRPNSAQAGNIQQAAYAEMGAASKPSTVNGESVMLVLFITCVLPMYILIKEFCIQTVEICCLYVIPYRLYTIIVNISIFIFSSAK